MTLGRGNGRAVVSRLAVRLAPRGIDLVAGGPVGPCDRRIAPGRPLERPQGDRSLVVVVGASRGLWPAFSAALRSNRQLLERGDPLDSWVDREIRSAARAAGELVDYRPAWDTGADLVAVQELALRIGLAPIAPCHLSAHPTFGPWFSLRAVIVFDAVWTGPGPVPASEPCAGCPAPCRATFDEAVRRPSNTGDSGWRRWLAVRDACPVGRSHRYPEDQLRYHYLKDRSILVGLAGQE